jgi:hypothetical protein
MCSRQTNKNSLNLKQSSHLLYHMLQKIPETLSLIEHQKYKRFPGEDSRPGPPIFLTNHLRAGVMQQKVKLGQAKLPKRD